MIITFAGTSGSGKSHLMRAFLDWARKNSDVEEYKKDDLPGGKVLGYVCRRNAAPDIFVLGAYDIPTGGCDTIHDVKQVFDEIKQALAEDLYVLYEGLFVMNMTRGPQLVAEVDCPVYVLQLTTPLATCFASINTRRAERGEGELSTRKNTEDNYRRATNYCAKMRDAGARVIKVSRDEALPKLLELLGER